MSPNTQHQSECLECGGSIELAADVMQGEIFVCPDCGVELEVISLVPLTIDLAPMEMEDWGE
jgi:alpha-aminoadipate/glutamate carrier protein LysW